jgi:threonine/homoserine/homoserine lactone efflux protein
MLQNYSSEFLSLAFVHFLPLLLPGPDFAITIHQSVRFGRTIGVITALGIGLVFLTTLGTHYWGLVPYYIAIHGY